MLQLVADGIVLCSIRRLEVKNKLEEGIRLMESRMLKNGGKKNI